MKIKLLIFLVFVMAAHSAAMEQQITKSPLRWADNEKDDFLFRVVLARDVVAVKQALQDGANIEARCIDGIDKGKTPLSFACSFSDPLIVGQLLCLGANCNTLDARGLPPLYHALQVIHTPHCVPMVDALVRHGADIGIPKIAPAENFIPEGFTPLHRMAQILHYKRFGDKDENDAYDIRTAKEVYERLEVILCIMVKEVMHQAYREGNPMSWQSKLKALFSKQDANNKAAYQLFQKYNDFAVVLKKPLDSNYNDSDKSFDRHDLLEFKLCKLLHPAYTWQYNQSPFDLTEEVRKERECLKQ